MRDSQRQDTAEKKFLQNVLGPRVRIARTKLGISQPQLADWIGVTSGSTISHWENGDYGPTQRQLPRLAEALRVTVDWLCGVDSPPTLDSRRGTDIITRTDSHFTKEGGDDVTTDPKYLAEGSDSMETHNPPPSGGTPGSSEDWKALAHRLMDYLEQREQNEASRIHKVEAITAEAFKSAAEAQKQRALADHEAQLNMKTILSGGLPHIARPADEAGAEASGT